MRRAACAILVMMLALSAGAAAETLLSVHFIDVGLGDAILVDYGVFEALIDGGRYSGCSDYIAEYIDGFLEVLVATQVDSRHIGGLDEVLADYAVATVYTNGDAIETEAFQTFVAAVNAEGAFVGQVRSGDTIALADLRFDVLHPTDLGPDIDDNALVLRLSFMGWDFLFPSSIDSAIEEQLVATGVGYIDILKVARYGSGDATSSALLQAIRPLACVISVGPNPDGDPATDVLDRIGCAPSDPVLFRTDIHGSIVFSVTDTGEVVYRTSIAEDPLHYPCTTAEADPPPDEPPCDCSGGDILNCEDFPCQSLAQACLEYCLKATGLDVHGLDHDQDGTACEELPQVCP